MEYTENQDALFKKNIFKRGQFYTGFDKCQALDGLSTYLSNSNSIYKELVKPIISNKVAKDIQIKVVASQIKWNMLHEAHCNGGKVEVVGKSKYYPVGNWDIKCNSKGEFFEVITLDLHGEDKDIFEKDYLERRLENFLNMGHEVNLLRNLKSMGFDVRGSSDYEDRILKADLVLYNSKNKKIGVSVYKSSNRTALDKLRNSNKDNFHRRVAYNVLEYGKPSVKDNVRRWVADVSDGYNEIIFKEDGTKFVKKRRDKK